MTKTLEGKVALVHVHPAVSGARSRNGLRRTVPRLPSISITTRGSQVTSSAQSRRQGVARSQSKVTSDAPQTSALPTTRPRPPSGASTLWLTTRLSQSRGSIESLDEEAIDELIGVNLKSVILAQEAAVRLRDGGRVVNMSTTLPAAHIGVLGAYAATKGGVELLLARWPVNWHRRV